jgi:hypothetical protein
MRFSERAGFKAVSLRIEQAQHNPAAIAPDDGRRRLKQSIQIVARL